MEAAKVVLLGLAAAVVYSVAHDQVTVRVCLEYFTIGHPKVFDTESPTLLALGWGVIATWWVGLPLGLLLAASARIGPEPRLTARQLLPLVGILLAAMAALALLAGLAGYVAARNGRVRLLPWMADGVPADRHPAFLADLWAHTASYASGALGGLVLCGVAVVRRLRGRIPPCASGPAPPSGSSSA
jgi:hypothetical protein